MNIIEKLISKSAMLSYYYAYHINDRFELGEKAISRSAHYSYHYSLLIGKRFVLGEKAIWMSYTYWKNYASLRLSNKELEEIHDKFYSERDRFWRF